MAKLKLSKKWNLKTKFKFTLALPSIEEQRKHLTPIFDNINKDIQKTKELQRIDFANINEQDLFNYLRKKNWYFIDQDFLPSNKSIGLPDSDSIQKYECYIHWRRIKFIILNHEEAQTQKTIPKIYFDGIFPTDVKQGKLGDCWILSAISALAEHPRLVKRLILTKKPNEFGLYRVKLCKMSKWKIIVLDDFFPCFPLSDPIFSQNEDKEVWVLLLEKAFAKLFGSYNALIAGDCRHSLIDLTGCPTFTY